MNKQVLIAGGGIGGLAAALALSRNGHKVCLLERASAFAEIGAGVQLGPNVTRLLHGWGLADALSSVAAFPDKLEVRSAGNGHLLGRLRLGEDFAQRYGAPYATLHRADLHGLLLQAVQQAGSTEFQLSCSLQGFQQTLDSVSVQTREGSTCEGGLLVGADGLWSRVRSQLIGDDVPRTTGHLAYRALVAQARLPDSLQSQNVTVWLGQRLHVVQYPVRRGEFMNVVAFVEGTVPGDLQSWNHGGNCADLTSALGATCAWLQDLVGSIPSWQLWVMHDRAPMQGPHQHARGRVALLGDAAHPMSPYLAQGAGMAIEDAAALASALDGPDPGPGPDIEAALQRFAENRWRRNARVQAKAQRNGEIFHATGLKRLGRDAAMKLLGERILDMPWLYGYASNAL